MFEITAIQAFKDNYIWLLRKGDRAVLVDPGEASPVLAYLAAEGLCLAAVLVTHKHADHQGGIAELLAAADENIPVYGPVAESITGLTHPLSGGETIHLDALEVSLRVLAVPGHTLGHLAYYGHGALFCGDTLFGAGCGRLFEGSPAQMYASLVALADLPDDTLVYCAHEYTESNLRFALAVEPDNPALARRCAEVAELRDRGHRTVPSTLALEKETNPFLRTQAAAVVAAARARDSSARDPVSVFAVLREWKNVF